MAPRNQRRMDELEDSPLRKRAKQLLVGQQDAEAARLGVPLAPVQPGDLNDGTRRGIVAAGSQESSIRSSSRNMSAQGSLFNMWRNGRLTGGQAGNPAGSGADPQTTLNQARTSGRAKQPAAQPGPAGAGYDPSLTQEDYAGNIVAGLLSVGAGNKDMLSAGTTAAGALTRTRQPISFALASSATTDEPSRGIATTGSGVGALFGTSDLPKGNYYIPGESGRPAGTIRRAGGAEISVGGTSSPDALTFRPGITYKPPAGFAPLGAKQPTAAELRSSQIDRLFPDVDQTPMQSATDAAAEFKKQLDRVFTPTRPARTLEGLI